MTAGHEAERARLKAPLPICEEAVAHFEANPKRFFFNRRPTEAERALFPNVVMLIVMRGESILWLYDMPVIAGDGRSLTPYFITDKNPPDEETLRECATPLSDAACLLILKEVTGDSSITWFDGA